MLSYLKLYMTTSYELWLYYFKHTVCLHNFIILVSSIKELKMTDSMETDILGMNLNFD